MPVSLTSTQTHIRRGVTLILSLKYRLHHKPLPVRYPGPSKPSHHPNSPPVFHKRSSMSGKVGPIWLTVIKFMPFYWHFIKRKLEGGIVINVHRPQDHYKTQFSQQIYADYLNYHKRRNQILFPRCRQYSFYHLSLKV